ncbi:MAG: hypothetical protein ACPKPY_14180 [Nitrososphaeraceae archaeon]
MKEKELFCYQCNFNNNQHEKQKKHRSQEDKFEPKKDKRSINNIINIISASLILFLGIIFVVISYPSFMYMSTNIDDIISQEIIHDDSYDDGFIYIFPFPVAIPIENNIFIIIPIISFFIIIIIVIIIFFRIISFK